MLHTAWIARHGHRHDYVDADWFNKAERPYDPPLSEDGLFQAQELGERLQSEQIVHLFSSPFLRAVQTAHHAAEALDLPIKLEAGLSEWHNSEWMSDMPERLSTDELAEHYPRHRFDLYISKQRDVYGTYRGIFPKYSDGRTWCCSARDNHGTIGRLPHCQCFPMEFAKTGTSRQEVANATLWRHLSLKRQREPQR